MTECSERAASANIPVGLGRMESHSLGETESNSIPSVISTPRAQV